jgi:hypothetical protein
VEQYDSDSVNVHQKLGFHARVPSCHQVPFHVPCCMPPYSHADIPFKFPHRNSQGVLPMCR